MYNFNGKQYNLQLGAIPDPSPPTSRTHAVIRINDSVNCPHVGLQCHWLMARIDRPEDTRIVVDPDTGQQHEETMSGFIQVGWKMDATDDPLLFFYSEQFAHSGAVRAFDAAGNLKPEPPEAWAGKGVVVPFAEWGVHRGEFLDVSLEADEGVVTAFIKNRPFARVVDPKTKAARGLVDAGVVSELDVGDDGLDVAAPRPAALIAAGLKFVGEFAVFDLWDETWKRSMPVAGQRAYSFIRQQANMAGNQQWGHVGCPDGLRQQNGYFPGRETDSSRHGMLPDGIGMCLDSFAPMPVPRVIAPPFAAPRAPAPAGRSSLPPPVRIAPPRRRSARSSRGRTRTSTAGQPGVRGSGHS
jgi:hypothetical protein